MRRYTGAISIDRQAIVWAKRPPPSRRVRKPVSKTAAAPARVAKIRRPTRDWPNSSSANLAIHGTSGAWST